MDTVGFSRFLNHVNSKVTMANSIITSQKLKLFSEVLPTGSRRGNECKIISSHSGSTSDVLMGWNQWPLRVILLARCAEICRNIVSMYEFSVYTFQESIVSHSGHSQWVRSHKILVNVTDQSGSLKHIIKTMKLTAVTAPHVADVVTFYHI